MINADRFYHSSRAHASTSEFGFFAVKSRCLIAKIKAEYHRFRFNIATFLNNPEDIEYHNLHQTYYSRMSSNTVEAYKLFGDDLINPSINGPKSEALYPLYKENGKETAKRKITKIISSNESTEFKLDDERNPKYLKDGEQRFRGICKTECLEFISDFQKIAHKTITPKDMKSLSEKFTDGGNKQTVRIHSLQSMDFKKVDQEIQLLDPVKFRESLNWEHLNNIKTDLVGLSVTTEIKDEGVSIESVCQESDASTLLTTLPDLLREIDEKSNPVPDAQKYVGELYNLSEVKVGLSNFTFDKKISETSNEIMKFADALSTGEYIINTWPPKNAENILRAGHAIAYIKLENDRYLFDPNLGTVRIPKGKDVGYIKHCLDNIGHDSLYFSRCTRKDT